MTTNVPNLAWDATRSCFVDDNGNPVQGGVSICMGDGSDEYYKDLPPPIDTKAALEDMMDEAVAFLLEEDDDKDSSPFPFIDPNPSLVDCLRYGVYNIDELTEAFKISLLKLGPE